MCSKIISQCRCLDCVKRHIFGICKECAKEHNRKAITDVWCGAVDKIRFEEK